MSRTEYGNFDWSEPDEEVHRFVNDLERPIGTYLLGRRLYDVMVAWETLDDEQPIIKDYVKTGEPPTRSSSPGAWTGR